MLPPLGARPGTRHMTYVVPFLPHEVLVVREDSPHLTAGETDSGKEPGLLPSVPLKLPGVSY